MTERPEIVDRYRELTAQITKLEKEKDEIKSDVRKLVDNTGGWNDCYLQERNSRDFSDQLILEWINKDYPHLMERVTTPQLDWEKFTSLLNLQEIDIRKMPATCEVTYTTYALMTKKRKRNEID